MKLLHRLTLSPGWPAFGVSLFAFVVYLETLAPTVTFIDNGELAAVACTLGIAHPTGYPLFTLLGWMFSRLPIASEEIVRLNIMAAFFCAVGVYFFYLLVHVILTFLSKHSGVIKLRKDGNLSTALFVASAGASLLLAFSETYWSQAVSIEVYSLHVLFLSLVMLLFVKANSSEFDDAVAEGSRSEMPRGVWWILFAFTLGLAFTNHMTTILLALGLLFLYFATQGNSATSWKRIGFMTIPFVLGLSVYLYLPIRAAQSPQLNWGNTSTFERFLWHLSGKQYRVWIFSSTEAASRQLKYFLNTLPEEFAYIGIIAALIGLFTLWRGHRRLFVATNLLFLTCVLYSINYDIHDIDSYFLLAYFCIALWAGCGLLAMFFWISAKTSLKIPMLAALLIGVSLTPFFFHHAKTNERENYLVEDYTMNMFASLEPDALVFSFQWDYWVSASYYYQFVKGVRPDVVVVDKELLRRSWYLEELDERHPWLLRESETEVEAFRTELYKFEHDLPYNPNLIQARFVAMISSFIWKSLISRPVYVTREIEPEFTQGLQRVPHGLALRLMPDTLFHPTSMPSIAYRSFEQAGRLEDMIKRLYAWAFIAQGVYEYKKGGNPVNAERLLKRALEFDKSSAEARRWINAIGGQ
ncbi:MAG: DUF2723 domain-containing protein [Ignavibacteria bacterium]|nr:DUF2723 domain-containing protein [Ignavibacteria bacterium]